MSRPIHRTTLKGSGAKPKFKFSATPHSEGRPEKFSASACHRTFPRPHPTRIRYGTISSENRSLKQCAVEEDDADEQYSLGELYYDAQEYQSAVGWYKLSAEQSHAEAQFKLGLFYELDRSIERNRAEALKWYRFASEQGHAMAQFMLGVYCVEGKIIEQNYEEAVKWFKLAAEQGLDKTQYFLGAVYLSGWGFIAQNIQEAVKWFKLAAEQGHVESQFNLGKIYHKGGIVERGHQNEFRWRKISDKERISERQLDLWLGYDTKDEVGQAKALRCQLIQPRRGCSSDDSAAIKARLAPAEVVHENQHDVGFVRCLSGGR